MWLSRTEINELIIWKEKNLKLRTKPIYKGIYVQNNEEDRIVGVGELCSFFVCYACNANRFSINLLETCASN